MNRFAGRHLLSLLALMVALLAVACGDDDVTMDASVDAEEDTSDTGDDTMRNDTFSSCIPTRLEAPQQLLRGVVAGSQVAYFDMGNDFCRTVDITFESSDASIVAAPGAVSIEEGNGRSQVVLEFLAEGQATISASAMVADQLLTAELEVVVLPDSVPSCSGEGSGNLAPGGAVMAESGAGIFLAEGASTESRYQVEAFDATVSCSDDIVPDGFRALGPAVTFGPEATRLPREIEFHVPANIGLLSAPLTLRHLEFAYRAPGQSEARIVPVSTVHPEGEPTDQLVSFHAPRFGTYQAVVRETAGQERDRDFSYRAITGFSMGAGGAALIASRNPERFDFAAPLGGLVDWRYMLDYVRKYHLGGFCTEEQRQADPEGCAAGASTSRTPPTQNLFEHAQDFEHWHYIDEWDGQGGTFNRNDYFRIFRDLTWMYGNPNTNWSDDLSAHNILPPGVPVERFSMMDSARCDTPVVIPACEGTAPDCAPGTGFIDDEYNPDGAYPIVTFCDGGEPSGEDRDIGVWDPGAAQRLPAEMVVAVDVDGNDFRGLGEPVIRNGIEAFDDCGLDMLCNENEPGYDPDTNPDPAGDDYDYQYNPGGTEGNMDRDGERCGEGEAYVDMGLDGVIGTRQVGDGGFDYGEGNGCWDRAEGANRMLDTHNPRSLVATMSDEDLDDLHWYADGGIRDLFNFGVDTNHFIGAFAERGRPVRLYNDHPELHADGRPRYKEDGIDSTFVFTDVDWSLVGPYFHLRYGDVDASESAKIVGDGGHVGTAQQLLNRLLSAVTWASNGWPDGDRARVSDSICSQVSPACPEPNQFVLEFEASDGRVSPTSIVLPPGYFDPENADVRYPVIYFLHGYGMSPEDLLATGLIFWNFMTAGNLPEHHRLQKMIFVFPDGFCRDAECQRGTFYTDSPQGNIDQVNSPRMESYLLELMDFLDENYRTKRPETRRVVD